MARKTELPTLQVRKLSSSEVGRGTILDPCRMSEIREETLRLIFDGYTLAAIGEAFGASRSRMSRWCRAEVLKTRAPLRFTKHYNGRTLSQMMWDRVEPTARDECWLWKGSIKPNGYGTLTYKGECHHAHRLVYETLVGEIPEDKVIDHICRNKACVNPIHLQIVTQTENIMLGYRRRRAA